MNSNLDITKHASVRKTQVQRKLATWGGATLRARAGKLVLGAAMVAALPLAAASSASAATTATIKGSFQCSSTTLLGNSGTSLNLWVPDNGSVKYYGGAAGVGSYSRTVTVYRSGQNYVNWDLGCPNGSHRYGQYFFASSGTTSRNIY